MWYKAPPYRSRAVIDLCGILQEFWVWDSTAELQYLVMSHWPDSTGGWSEEKITDLVTRDSMIGTGLAREVT